MICGIWVDDFRTKTRIWYKESFSTNKVWVILSPRHQNLIQEKIIMRPTFISLDSFQLSIQTLPILSWGHSSFIPFYK